MASQHKNTARAIVVYDNQLLAIRRNKFGEEYYTLPGGGVQKNELVFDAVSREVMEETSLRILPVRELYRGSHVTGHTTYFVLCEYLDGVPTLHPNSEEALLSAVGNNTYQPLWLPLKSLSSLPLPFYPDSPEFHAHLISDLAKGFPLKEVITVQFIG
jgi:ADP-ribose pyrophosphatase YjhB (NUDIX family)